RLAAEELTGRVETSQKCTETEPTRKDSVLATSSQGVFRLLKTRATDVECEAATSIIVITEAAYRRSQADYLRLMQSPQPSSSTRRTERIATHPDSLSTPSATVRTRQPLNRWARIVDNV
ncbi:hypothetical protein LTR53_017977, partial [Teratosphaeriaceae sp. CCFEE 6253]